jgi:hypothetical protein
MSSQRQALKHFWVATQDPNRSPDATNDRLVTITTSYTCTFHLKWLLLGKFLLAGMTWWWSSQTVSEGDYSPVSSLQYHVFYLTVTFCLTLLFIVLVFSNKTLGTFSRRCICSYSNHIQLWSRTNKPKHFCRCTCSTRCEYLELPSLPLWPWVQHLFNPCVHSQNICPQRWSPHLQTQTTCLLSSEPLRAQQ